MALSQEDTPKLVNELNKTGNSQRLKPQTVCALQMALYTGLRDHSVRGAKWKEIDFLKKEWTVPGSRMKSGREHKVPLPKLGIAALKKLEPVTFKTEEDFIFSAKTKRG